MKNCPLNREGELTETSSHQMIQLNYSEICEQSMGGYSDVVGPHTADDAYILNEFIIDIVYI